MPTVSTVTVKSSGGDYTSLSAAEAGEQADLVSDDVQLDIECYSFEDTTAVTINGWTTDATRYLRIYTPAAERHAGVWSTSKYRLSVSTGFAACLRINEDYVRVDGLQIEHTNVTTSSRRSNIWVDSIAVAASSDIRVDNCICRNAGGSSGANDNIRCGSGKTTIRNTIVYGNDHGAGVQGTFGSNSPEVNCDNVTVANVATYGFTSTSSTLTLRNCYSHGGTDAYNGTMTRTTCAHSSATVFAGSTASVAHSTSTFVNVTAGSEDYHLVSGSALIDQGTDLSSDFTTDIDGDTRSGTWDIGADELAATGGGSAAMLLNGGLINRGLVCGGLVT